MTAPEFPKDGSFTYGPRDPETGEAWCYVSRKMAHEHPKGRLGPIEYAIVGYFLIAAGIKLMLIFQYGVPNWSMPLAGLLQILTALGLLWRVPGALVLVIVQLVVTVGQAVSSFGASQSAMPLIEVVLAIGIMAYLHEGVRPNLIYRYRFRSEKPEGEGP